MGLAVLTSSLASAVNAATLEDYREAPVTELRSTMLTSSIQGMTTIPAEKRPVAPEDEYKFTTSPETISKQLKDKVSETIPEEAIPRTIIIPPVSPSAATDTTLVSEEVLVVQIMSDDALEPEASERDSDASDNLVQATGTTADLKIKPFFNVNYNQAGGHDGFAGLEAFYPVVQTPGNNVGFLTGRLNLDVNDDLGGGLQAGYRALLSETTIWGVYSGFDIRETGDNTFGQLGLGAELLSDTWDAHLNASFPVGDTQQFVSSSSEISNPRFAGTNLVFDQASTELSEAAITTVSLDGGVQVFDCCGSYSP